MAENKSTEAGLKQVNSVADQVSVMLERFKKRLTLDNARLVDHYLENELAILVRFRLPVATEVDFVAHFSRSGFFIKTGEKEGRIFESKRHQNVLHDIGSLADGCDRDQQTVLVDSIKAINDGEIRALPAIVWLDTVDRVYSILPQALYFSCNTGFVLRGAAVGREVQIGVPNVSIRADEVQLLDQMVEGTPDALNDLARDGGHFDGNRRDLRDVIAQVSRIRVCLGDDFIGVGLEEGSENIAQLNEVLFGPFNFYPNEREPLIRSHRSSGKLNSMSGYIHRRNLL